MMRNRVALQKIKDCLGCMCRWNKGRLKVGINLVIEEKTKGLSLLDCGDNRASFDFPLGPGKERKGTLLRVFFPMMANEWILMRTLGKWWLIISLCC